MRNRRIDPSRRAASIEALEARRLLANVTVNVGTTIRSVNTDLLGVNTAPWDSNLPLASTASLMTAMGMTGARIGGGSAVDQNYHFNVNDPNNDPVTLAQQVAFVATHGGVGIITLNYGTGSPQEAAAELAYLNGSTTDATTIGLGEQWNTSTNTWVNVDWKTVGYWASLRAAVQLKTDDGLNFLRLGGSVSGQHGTINPVTHPSPFGIHYWEIGNELYGADWEVDEHGIGGDNLAMPAGKTSAAHDPTTYVSFAKQFATMAAEISPGISIGIDSGGPDTNSNDYTYYKNWLVNVLTQSNSSHQNLSVGFISDHNYVQEPGSENDSTLLSDPSAQPNPAPSEPLDWAQRASKYRNVINTYYGTAAGAGIELLATEFNSVSYNPGKQISSLVNGIFVADSLGELMQTEYNGAWIWDLHNFFDTGQNNSSTLYGWRNGGDYGLLGSNTVYGGTNNTQLESTLNEPFPNYFAEQLASKIIQPGGTVVSATSSDTNLDVFAVKESNGNVELMVINKAKSGLTNTGSGTPGTIAGNFTLNGFVPNAAAQTWQFGSAEDNAQKNSSTGATSLTSANPTLSLNGSSFSMNFPSLSMTVLIMTPAPPHATSMAFPYTAAANQVQFIFDQDMLSSSFATSDLQLINKDGGPVPAVNSVTYSSATKTATFFVASAGFHDDNYTATLPSGSVNSSYGTASTAAYSFSFFSLAADANHDRNVNALDFNALATNYGKAGTFAKGDFNYSGTVDSNDFAMLAARFGTSLAAPAGSAVAESAVVLSLLSSNPTPNLFSDQSVSTINPLLDE